MSARLRVTAALIAGAALVMSGCGVLTKGVYDTPLPGGADVGSNPITLTADFEDVLDLVPQSSVKVDNVAVGRVSKIRLNPDGRSAEVTLVVNRSTDLPAGTAARLQQTSLLGEKYVALVRPDEPVAGPDLKTGTHISLEKTSQAAQVEQVLGALSLVLNGGGIGQFQEISRELQKISTDRPEEIRAFLDEMETFVTGLADRKEAITTAIDGLHTLSTNLDADKGKIVKALDGLQPGMKVMVDQRKQLTKMLQALDRLSDVTVETLDAAQEDIIRDFEALEPILEQLAKAGEDLPKSLEILLTYPFPDSVLGAIKGDYLNVFIETNLRTLPAGCAAVGCAWPQAAATVSGLAYSPTAKGGGTVTGTPTLLPPTDSPLPGIPTPTVPVPVETVPTPKPTDGIPTPEPTPSDQATPPADATTTREDGEN